MRALACHAPRWSRTPWARPGPRGHTELSFTRPAPSPRAGSPGWRGPARAWCGCEPAGCLLASWAVRKPHLGSGTGGPRARLSGAGCRDAASAARLGMEEGGVGRPSVRLAQGVPRPVFRAGAARHW